MRLRFYISLFMISIYTLIGVLLIFILHFEQLQPTNRIAAGSVMLLYAAYRSYKLYREQKKINTEE